MKLTNANKDVITVHLYLSPQNLLHQTKQATVILDPEAYQPLSGTCKLLAKEPSPSELNHHTSGSCSFRELG